MKKISLALAAIVAMASIALSGCSTLGGDSRFGEAALGNLEHCDRTYIGTAGVGGSLSVTIKCPPKPYEAPQ